METGDRHSRPRAARSVRAGDAVAAFSWVLGIWLLLTWTTTVEQFVVGVLVAAVAAWPFAILGPVARPWRVLRPAWLLTSVRLVAVYLVSMARANVRLARRVWSPNLPLRSGMVVVPDPSPTVGARTALAVMSSTIVDYQLVAVDDEADTLQYHGVWIVDADPSANAERIVGSLAPHLARLAIT